MERLSDTVAQVRQKKIIVFVLVLSLMSLMISLFVVFKDNSKNKEKYKNEAIDLTNLDKIKKNKVIRVGYGGFPPYTIVNAAGTNNEDEVSGYSVDLINKIASLAEPEIQVEWVRFSWETIQTELMSGKFDMVADPVYQTVPRALEFSFTKPYAYFGIAVGVVRKDDNRFQEFEDLDRSDIVISLAKGWTSTEYAEKNLSKPELKIVPVTGDAFNQLDDVILGRADVALNDVPTVIQYVNAHSDKVKAVFLSAPPSSVPGGFVVNRKDKDLLQFLNTSIDILIANGDLKSIDEKWETYHYIPVVKNLPSKGLREYNAGL